jgi:hypothetical protein
VFIVDTRSQLCGSVHRSTFITLPPFPFASHTRILQPQSYRYGKMQLSFVLLAGFTASVPLVLGQSSSTNNVISTKSSPIPGLSSSPLLSMSSSSMGGRTITGDITSKHFTDISAGPSKTVREYLRPTFDEGVRGATCLDHMSEFYSSHVCCR